MSTTVSVNHFDRGKPFYPLIMNYLCLLHGFYELAVRGVILDVNALPKNKIKEFVTKDPQFDIERLIKSGSTELPRPLELKSNFDGNFIKVDVDKIAREVTHNVAYLGSFMMRSAGSLLILAYETTHQFHDKGPLWEFLHHCRNAAAHNGRFHFRRGEPRHPAEWGSFRIEAAMQGTPLFGDNKIHGLLGPGDPIRLLWDIEQAYPSMRV